MEEKDADMWWDAVQDIVQKKLESLVECMREMRSFIGIRYLRWKRSYHHFSMNLRSSLHNQNLR
jgi:hypothetical protein